MARPRPFSDEPWAELRNDIETHGEEDRSLMRDYAYEMRARIDAALARLKLNPCDCREDDCHHCELVRFTREALTRLEGRYEES